MWFGSTTRNARLELTVLIAECQTLAGDWRQSRLDLDDHLGNNGGAFDWQGEKFNLTAEDLRLEGTTLSARLQTRQFEWLEASTDLNYYVINEDGHLMIVDHWGFAASLGRNAVMDGGVLHAEYFTSTGEIQESSINLDDYIGNSDGVFHWGSNNFSATAQNIRLEGAVLHARLATCDGEWRDACTNLQPEIRNIEGNLQRVSSYFRATKVQHPDSDTSTPRSSWPPHLMEEEARRQRDNNEVRTQDDRRQALSECLITRELYQYDPLRKETNIRLLKLEPPGQDLDVIACSLVEAELGSAERFAALSYTWGSPFPPTIDSVEHTYKQITTILCNGNRMHIKQNLYDALRRLRDRKRPEKSQASSNGIDLIADVQSGTFSKVEDTLRLGADVKVRDSSGRTALHFAAKLGHLDMAKALVTAGSDIHALCRLNKRPLDYAKEGRGPYVESVASFLEEEHKSDHVRHRAHTSLRLEVTAFEYFWVDAICINQADEIEKAAQVSIMGDIYRASGCVNVWLGREFHNYLDSTELLLQGVWRLEQAREEDTLSADSLEQLVNDPVATFRRIGDSRIKRAAMEWLNTLGRETIRAWCRLPHLFHRTWFDRAWILQEALMARDLTIVCGRYIVPWDTFLLMSSIVECCQSLLGTDEAHAIFGSTLWHTWFGTALSGGMLMVRNKPEQGHISPLRLAQWRTECQREGRLSMVSALSLSRNQKATDARDKVFCVLAFSPIERKDDHGIQSIRPDYSLSLVWLYIDVAKSLLAVYGPCILSLGGLSSRLTNTKLPSWVPDLDSQLTSRLRGINVRQLHHTTSVTSSIGKVARNRPSGVHITSQNELVINCHLWDVVAETAHSGLNEMGRNLDGLARWLEVLSKLDATLEQRRHALLCSLAERPYVEHFNGSHFEDWLQFLCFTRIVGQSQVLRGLDTGFPFGIDDTRNRKIEEEQKPIPTLVSRAQELFAKLGYTLSLDTMKKWSDEEAWGPGVTLQYRDWYMDMTRDAMHYGQMLRDNNPTRRLLRTALTNMLGTGPEQAQAGDIIVLVDGVNVPYLLRRARDGKFELIGEVYIHDLDVEGKLRDARSRQIEQELCIV